VRKAELPGGTGMPKKRMPAAERRREHGTDDCSFQRSCRITGRIPGLVPGLARALTWAGELVRT
jgi:hypothetical protein